MRRWGDFSLAYETMARQFDVLRLPGVPGHLAYVVHDGTAMMVGDPVAEEPAAFVRAFVDWCRVEGKSPCALQVTESTAGALRDTGLATNGLGIETYLDLSVLDPELRGGKYQDIRNYLNVAARFGLSVGEEPIGSVDPTQVAAVSAGWKASKKNQAELRVLLRPITCEPEPHVRYFFARMGDRLLGYVFYSPICPDGRIVGYYSNIERFDLRGSALPRRLNLMRLINWQACQVFREEGAEFISLGLSPLADLDTATWNDNTELRGLFEQDYADSELYAFQGIARHKKAFPDTRKIPVYFAAHPDRAGEDILNIFRATGILG